MREADAGVRLCDAGGAEGDVTHFILAVPSLIWTVAGGEWERADHTAYIRTAGSEVIHSQSSLRFLNMSWCFGPPPLQNEFLRHRSRHTCSVSWVISVDQRTVQPDLFNLRPWKSCFWQGSLARAQPCGNYRRARFYSGEKVTPRVAFH